MLGLLTDRSAVTWAAVGDALPVCKIIAELRWPRCPPGAPDDVLGRCQMGRASATIL
jgi:hypothetical protein